MAYFLLALAALRATAGTETGALLTVTRALTDPPNLLWISLEVDGASDVRDCLVEGAPFDVETPARRAATKLAACAPAGAAWEVVVAGDYAIVRQPSGASAAALDTIVELPAGRRTFSALASELQPALRTAVGPATPVTVAVDAGVHGVDRRIVEHDGARVSARDLLARLTLVRDPSAREPLTGPAHVVWTATSRAGVGVVLRLVDRGTPIAGPSEEVDSPSRVELLRSIVDECRRDLAAARTPEDLAFFQQQLDVALRKLAEAEAP